MLLLKPAEGRVLAAGGENARKLLSDPIAAGKYAPSLIGDDDTAPLDRYVPHVVRACEAGGPEPLGRGAGETLRAVFSAIGAEVQKELSAYDRRPLERRRACFPAKRVEQSGGIDRVIIEEDSCARPPPPSISDSTSS
jgi:hypothetical protein